MINQEVVFICQKGVNGPFDNSQVLHCRSSQALDMAFEDFTVQTPTGPGFCKLQQYIMHARTAMGQHPSNHLLSFVWDLSSLPVCMSGFYVICNRLSRSGELWKSMQT